MHSPGRRTSSDTTHSGSSRPRPARRLRRAGRRRRSRFLHSVAIRAWRHRARGAPLPVVFREAMSVRGPFVVAFVLALIGALAHYVYRDLTAASRRYRIVQAVAPCDPDDPERRVFTTPEGKFCFEPDSDDTI